MTGSPAARGGPVAGVRRLCSHAPRGLGLGRCPLNGTTPECWYGRRSPQPPRRALARALLSRLTNHRPGRLAPAAPRRLALGGTHLSGPAVDWSGGTGPEAPC